MRVEMMAVGIVRMLMDKAIMFVRVGVWFSRVHPRLMIVLVVRIFGCVNMFVRMFHGLMHMDMTVNFGYVQPQTNPH